MDPNYDKEPASGQTEPPRYQEHPKDPSLPYWGPAGSVQPTVIAMAPLDTPLQDYLGYSIFTTLCCCLPLGVAALVYSISTRDANLQGNQEAAVRSSNTARKLNHAALGIGILMLVITIAFCAAILLVYGK